VLKATRFDRFGKFNRVARAVDVGGLLACRVSGEIVNRGEVKKVFDLALELRHVRSGHAQFWFAEITNDGYYPLLRCRQPPPRVKRLEFFDGVFPHQHKDSAFAFE